MKNTNLIPREIAIFLNFTKSNTREKSTFTVYMTLCISGSNRLYIFLACDHLQSIQSIQNVGLNT